MKTFVLSAFTSIVLLANLCSAALEFSGYSTFGEEMRFVLVDTDAGGSSGWIAIGREFHDYTLVRFDQTKEVLSVRRGGSLLELPLRPPRVATASHPLIAEGAVEIAGCVAKPRKIIIPPEQELTMKGALRMAGNWTRVADIRHVTVTRKKSDGKSEITEVDLGALFSSRQDIKLEAGDHIFVPERKG